MKLISIAFAVLCLASGCSKDSSVPGNTSPDFSAVAKVLDDSAVTVFDNKCFTLIHVDGKEVFSRGYGGYDANTKMLIASCSKWLSATVIMAMVDEGKFSLADSIGKYLPVFTANGKGHVPIRFLFTHTSGFPGNSVQGYESDASLTLASAVDLIAKNVPLRYEPGTVLNYGGVSMHIAGRIAEIVSGKSWNTLIADKIYKPCGMTNTDFGQSQNPLIAGGARSTPSDYIKLLDMLMRKGLAADGTRVLSEASVIEMEKDQTLHARVEGTPYPASYFQFGLYGLGNWRDLTDNSDNLIESSSPGAFGSHPWVNRGKKITGFIFTFIPAAGAGGFTLGTASRVRQLAREIVK